MHPSMCLQASTISTARCRVSKLSHMLLWLECVPQKFGCWKPGSDAAVLRGGRSFHGLSYHKNGFVIRVSSLACLLSLAMWCLPPHWEAARRPQPVPALCSWTSSLQNHELNRYLLFIKYQSQAFCYSNQIGLRHMCTEWRDKWIHLALADIIFKYTFLTGPSTTSPTERTNPIPKGCGSFPHHICLSS
jgi:hypothetical protein